jgi:hypothetical protein
MALGVLMFLQMMELTSIFQTVSLFLQNGPSFRTPEK